MAENALAVETRQGAGKGVARKLRAAGRIPAICYGGGSPPAAIALDPRLLEHLIHTSEAGVNTLIDLRVAGGGDYDGKKVLVKELQRDPANGALLHADFYAVDLMQTVEVSVPVHVTGSAHGVLMGGILDHPLREIEVECLPEAIPREVTIDVSALDIGDALHVRDLVLPAGVKLVSDPDLTVVSLMAPTVEEEAPAAEAPEVAVEGEEAAEAPEKAEKPGAAGDE